MGSESVMLQDIVGLCAQYQQAYVAAYANVKEHWMDEQHKPGQEESHIHALALAVSTALAY